MGPYPNVDWEPLPLELPLEEPCRRSPASQGEELLQNDPEDRGRTVIVIDLA